MLLGKFFSAVNGQILEAIIIKPSGHTDGGKEASFRSFKGPQSILTVNPEKFSPTKVF